MRRRPDNADEPMSGGYGGYGNQRGGSSRYGGLGGGGGLESNSGDRINETNRNIMEMENNRHMNDLGDQVSLLKNLTIDIGQEVKSQNELLDGMGGQMFDTSGLLGGTLKRINKMMARGGSKHMCYLIVFIVFTFLVIWWILGHR